MKRSIRLLSMLAPLMLGLAFAPQASHAEALAEEISFTPLAGYHLFEGDQNIDDDATYGFALGYNLDPKWTIELSTQFTGTEDEAGGMDVNSVVSHIDALYHFATGGGLRPYLSAGLGGMNIDPDAGRSDTHVFANYGAGLKYYLSDDIALRTEARHLVSTDFSIHNLLLLAGVSFEFGGKKPALPTPKPIDTDGDGIFDGVDLCPNSPPGVTIDFAGCPVDEDHDGIADYLDQCPMTPLETLVGVDGCPLDSDVDGVLNDADQCPETPPGVMVDDEGCELKFTLNIEFDLDRAQIRPEYYPELERAAQFIERYPAPYILIAGHTDSRGEEAYNRELSKRRAQSVRAHLINNFDLSPDKLVARGFGESQPLAENDTEAGRQTNRRVEILCCTLIPPEQ